MSSTRLLGRKTVELLSSKEGVPTVLDLEQSDRILPSMINGLLPPRHLEEFVQLERMIGRGGFATVYRGVATEKARNCGLKPGAIYAVKRNDKCALPDIRKSLCKVSKEREFAFLQSLVGVTSDVPVVKLHAIFLEFPWQVSLVMDHLAGPDLFDYLSTSTKPFSEQDAVSITRQVINGVEYLHYVAGLLHRDLKPDNCAFVRPVLPDQPLPPVKVFDIGSGWVLPEPITDETARDVQSMLQAGTLLYVAPEFWKGLGGGPSDMWSVGLLTHLFLTSELPFSLMDRHDYRRATKEEIDLETGAWKVLSGEARDFVASLLAKAPKHRATARVALAHPWLAQCSVAERAASGAAQTEPVC